jgi:hypothetical protein
MEEREREYNVQSSTGGLRLKEVEAQKCKFEICSEWHIILSDKEGRCLIHSNTS